MKDFFASALCVLILGLLGVVAVYSLKAVIQTFIQDPLCWLLKTTDILNKLEEQKAEIKTLRESHNAILNEVQALMDWNRKLVTELKSGRE